MHSASPGLYYISNDKFVADVRALAYSVVTGGWIPDFVIGIGRGGLVPSVYISHQLALPMLSVDHSSQVPDFADELLRKVAEHSAAGTKLLFVDDINDSGGTIDYVRMLLAANGCNPDNLRFAVLINNSRSKATVDYWAEMIDRADDKRWFVFPWEAMADAAAIPGDALAMPERLA